MTYLQHHGILGQKWGVRRYQNPDGTLTKLGKNRHNENKSGILQRVKGAAKKDGYQNHSIPGYVKKDGYQERKLPGNVIKNIVGNASKRPNGAIDEYRPSKLPKNGGINPNNQKPGLTDKQKKTLKVGAVAVGATAAAVGTAILAKKGSIKLKDLAVEKYTKLGAEALDRIYSDNRRSSEAISNKMFDALDKNDRETYRKLRKLGSEQTKQLAQETFRTKRENDADIERVKNSTKEAFQAVYGKDKHKLPDYTLRSMGIRTI